MAKRKNVKGEGRARIVEGAIRCFAKKGVANTTLREITTAAGVDQPLFHYHFKSIDELYADVVYAVRDSLGSESVDTLVGETNPLDLMRKYIKGTLEWGKRNPGFYSIWIYFYYLATYEPEFGKLGVSFRQTGRNRVELFIHRGVEQGVFKLAKGLRADEAAYAIHTFLTGALVMSGGSVEPEWNKAIEVATRGALLWLGANDG